MKIQGNNFAVIGGAGFIGGHLCELLVERGANKVVVFDNFVRGKKENLVSVLDKVTIITHDITDDYFNLKHGFDYYNIDGVFHLAASWLDECHHNPGLGLEVNVNGFFRVLEACKDSNIKRLVFSSSASVYGDQPDSLNIAEDAPYLNKNFYGATKIAGEHLFRAYHFQHGLQGACLRYMNVYGPRMDTKGEYVGLIPRVLENMKNGEPIIVAGDGEQEFDFVYVTDVARANILAMKADPDQPFSYFPRMYDPNYKSFGYFNVGTGIGTSINYVVSRLIALAGDKDVSYNIQYDPSLVKPGAVTRRVGNPHRADIKLGFKSEVYLEEGLRRTVEWWKNQNAKSR